MGDKYYQGYSTSEDESEADQEEKRDSDNENEQDPSKLDKEELAQLMLEDSIKPRWYVLSARQQSRFIWDLIIIVFAIINAVTLPLDIAFPEKMANVEGLAFMDNFTNFLFFCDIVIGFFTSYINVASGDEIYGLRMIAINYII